VELLKKCKKINTSLKGLPTLGFHFKNVSQQVSLNECFMLGRFQVQTPACGSAIFTEDIHGLSQCLLSRGIVAA
jgi:hypothetical protein